MVDNNDSVDEVKKKVDKIFNKLRARLFNMIEQMQIDNGRVDAYKQTIRDITGDGWNSINELVDGKKDK